MENIKDIPDLHYMDLDLFNLVVEAYGNRKNNTLEKKTEAARPALEMFVANEIFELVDASVIDGPGLAKYFGFKDGPRNNFCRMLRDVTEPKSADEPQPIMHTPSPTPSFQIVPGPSSVQVDPNTAPQALIAGQASTPGMNPSVFSYTRSDQLPDVVSLFDTPVELRDLRDRISVQVYLHDRKGLNRDRGAAAQVVFNDLVLFARLQPKNKNVIGWNKLNIRVEYFEVCAEALVRAFPCTASIVVDRKGKPTDVFYRYDKDANPTQSGILFEKLRAQKTTEKNQAKKRAAPSTTPSQNRKQKTRPQPQNDTSADRVLDALSDPLQNSGLLTIEANKMKLLELYTSELVEKRRGITDKDVMTKCSGLFSFNGALVSCKFFFSVQFHWFLLVWLETIPQ